MKEITLRIPNGKVEKFIALIRSLGYVKILEPSAISEAQQIEVGDRLDKIEKGEMTVRIWAEAKHHIYKKK